MILSYSRNFLFIKTKKVGGTSLEIALSKYCGDKDILAPMAGADERRRKALGVRGAQNYEKRGVFSSYSFSPHTHAGRMRNFLPTSTWNRLFKFTVVRNPYDATISRYAMHLRNGKATTDFKSWIFENRHKIRDNLNIYCIDGRPFFDYAVRYEALEADLAEVSRRIGLDENVFDLFTTIRAKGALRPPGFTIEAMFGDFEEGIELVAQEAAEELEWFGYQRPKLSVAPSR
jgi:hypothetical protein